MSYYTRKQYDRIILARFKENDSVTSAASFAHVYRVRPREYLQMSAVGKLAELLWATAVLVLFGLVTLVVAISYRPIFNKVTSYNLATSLLFGLLLVAFWMFCVYRVLISQAYLRWMIAHRK